MAALAVGWMLVSGSGLGAEDAAAPETRAKAPGVSFEVLKATVGSGSRSREMEEPAFNFGAPLEEPAAVGSVRAGGPWTAMSLTAMIDLGAELPAGTRVASVTPIVGARAGGPGPNAAPASLDSGGRTASSAETLDRGSSAKEPRLVAQAQIAPKAEAAPPAPAPAGPKAVAEPSKAPAPPAPVPAGPKAVAEPAKAALPPAPAPAGSKAKAEPAKQETKAQPPALEAALEQWHRQVLVNYTYNITGLADPFLPIRDVRGRPDRAGEEAGLPPILRLELNQLKLVAITVMSGDSGAALASFEDGAGVSYILRQGDRIGRRQGRIVAIEPDRVLIEEASARGASAPRLTEMKLDVLRDAPGLISGAEAAW